jgi:hypothetical protein
MVSILSVRKEEILITQNQGQGYQRIGIAIVGLTVNNRLNGMVLRMQFAHGRSSLHLTFFVRQESHACEARFRRPPGEPGESPPDFLFVAEDDELSSRFIGMKTGCCRQCGEPGI